MEESEFERKCFGRMGGGRGSLEEEERVLVVVEEEEVGLGEEAAWQRRKVVAEN